MPRSAKDLTMPCLKSCALLAAAMLALTAPGGAGQRPAPPDPTKLCKPFSAPAEVQQRYLDVGGVATLGCFVSSSGSRYVFGSGQIVDNFFTYYPSPGSTYAVVIGRDHIFHLYWNISPDLPAMPDDWIVRLSYDDGLVNQVTYKPNGTTVEPSYGANVLVHPGNRHGTFQIALEACLHGAIQVTASDCMGWTTISTQY